jgi:hypothetical protein
MPSSFNYKPAGNGGANVTGPITLSAASGGAQTITPATHDVYVTLPDATGLSKSSNVFVISNAGDFDLGIKNSVGTKLGWLRQRTTGVVALSDNSTPAGVWSIENLFKTGITMQYSSPTAPTGTGNLQMYNAIALDADRTCLLFGWGNIYAIIYNSATRTFGTITLVKTQVAGSITKFGIKSATDRVLVVSADNASQLDAVVLSISGTAITVNTLSNIVTLPAGISQVNYLIAVGSSFVQSYIAGAVSYAVAISITGTTPTIGTPEVVQNTAQPSYLYASGSVLRTVTYNGGSLWATPYTVSGSTLTIGTGTSTAATSNFIRVFLNGNGNIVANYQTAGSTVQSAAIFKLTGTTEAVSAVALITTGQFIISTDYAVISASKTVFLTNDGSSSWYANILTDTGGTASAGTVISGSGTGVFTAPSATRVSGNTAQFVMAVPTRLYQITLDCSGTSAVATSVITQVNTTSSGFVPTVTTSNFDGTKGNTTLRNGGLYHCIGDNPPFDWFVTAGLIRRVEKLNNWFLPNFPSTDDNIGYCASSLNGNSNVGVIIQRIEAAA